jgi:hypothetical protein
MLSNKDVLIIKQRIAAGDKQFDIAADFDISQCYVSQIKHNNYRFDKCHPDVSTKHNYWSHILNKKISNLIIKLYNKGYYQREIAAIISKMNKEGKFNMRRYGKLHQSHISKLLKANNIPIRSLKLNPYVIKQVIRLRKEHYKYIDISRTLKVCCNSVYKYCKEQGL